MLKRIFTMKIKTGQRVQDLYTDDVVDTANREHDGVLVVGSTKNSVSVISHRRSDLVDLWEDLSDDWDSEYKKPSMPAIEELTVSA